MCGDAFRGHHPGVTISRRSETNSPWLFPRPQIHGLCGPLAPMSCVRACGRDAVPAFAAFSHEHTNRQLGGRWTGVGMLDPSDHGDDCRSSQVALKPSRLIALFGSRPCRLTVGLMHFVMYKEVEFGESTVKRLRDSCLCMFVFMFLEPHNRALVQGMAKTTGTYNHLG